MVPRSQFVRLSDILENIDAASEMIEGVELGGYRRDLKLRRAVERCVERHHYERVDDLIMWKIATQSLPQLRPSIVAMIEKAKS
jgi:uncharacterized protein with HEPN domain